MADTLHPPPSVIASWPGPDYVNPQTRGPALKQVCIIFSGLGLIVVSARIYSRLVITRAPGGDDLLVVVGLVFSVAMSSMVVVGNELYFSGRHIWDVPSSVMTPHRLNVWISEWLFVLAGTAIKTSVLLFYQRLSVKFNKGFLVATWLGIVYNVLYLLAFTLTLLLICRPVDAYWNSFDQKWAATHNFYCAKEGASIPAAVALSTFGDLYSTLLPLLLVFSLKLPLKQSLALYGLFGLGFLACALGVVRVVLTYRLFNETYDFTWLLWEIWIWSVAELYVGIFAASAPALQPFFRQFLVGSIGSLARYSRQRGDTEGTASDAHQEEKRGSSSVAGETRAEAAAIGMAYSGDETTVHERGFWKDMGRQGTRRFELGSDRDGKVVLVQVREQDTAAAAAAATSGGPGQPSREDSNAPKAVGSAENWPLPPAPTKPLPPLPTSSSPGSRNRWSLPSQASQQTIHVVLQLDPEVADPGSAAGSVQTAKLRARSPLAQSQHGQTASMLEKRKPIIGSQSAKAVAGSIRHGVNWSVRAALLSISRAATVKGNSGLIRSAATTSRDFDPDRRPYVHGRRDGFAV
ncbi:hypothetical protein G647_04715 [Cladophialophora carrionii CBS 160.54]|uniref:Rhodopsin domain-containing protein n=1 Tax=Cladophialophora carrionii CBS 160.54 TaxID=1279043 RepID=V9D8E6_9EURO|nr:uncharacterized protein G647_04715 [Cladophialophora carrionii CBS 160.54]ETI22921.1 hypothetical protein G647_04715 [Cladophialophora carrionii CBS 160.54]